MIAGIVAVVIGIMMDTTGIGIIEPEVSLHVW